MPEANFDNDPGPYEMPPGRGGGTFSTSQVYIDQRYWEGQVGGESELGGQVGLGKVLWKEGHNEVARAAIM